MFPSLTLALTALLSLPSILSLPLDPRGDDVSSLSFLSTTNFKSLASILPQACSVSKISVPLGVSTLTVPAGQSSSTIAVGRGVQNYTCTAGAYVSTGALASLFDVSCLYSLTAGKVDPSLITSLVPKIAYNSLGYPDTGKLPIAIHHLFVDTPNTNVTGSISPEFVANNDRVLVSKVAAFNDPTDPTNNVPWLQLAAVEGQGTLAKSVYRLGTYKGQPPTSCSTEGANLSVKYAAMYWFTK
ncbi:hypothetical protein IAT38_005641 [Cryptococcus sp. DSM 104549]